MNGRERLLEIAPLIYGPRWMTALEERLGVNRRSLGRYKSGLRQVPTAVLQDLESALVQRFAEIVGALGSWAAIEFQQGLYAVSPDGQYREIPEALRSGLALALEEMKRKLSEEENGDSNGR